MIEETITKPVNSRGLRCSRCGYDLTGLSLNRCPECGLEFDPQRLVIVEFRRESVANRILVADAIAAVIVCGLLLAQLVADPFRTYAGSDVFFICGGITAALLAYGIYNGFFHFFSRYHCRRLFLAWLLTIGIVLFAVLCLRVFEK